MSITKFDDVIDSRDVIARIEELRDAATPWAAGWNMPGYMPDNEPAGFAEWSDARDYLASEVERAADETDDENEAAEYKAAAEAMRALPENAEIGETVGAYHWWASFNGDNAGLSADEAAELETLEDLAKQGADYAADWEYGEALIRGSYFPEYAQELADDIGAIPANASWPNNCIDWDKAARELQTDYTAVDFGGVTYWIR